MRLKAISINIWKNLKAKAMGEDYPRYDRFCRGYVKPRTMKQIKADYTNMINKHYVSKVKR